MRTGYQRGRSTLRNSNPFVGLTTIPALIAMVVGAIPFPLMVLDRHLGWKLETDAFLGLSQESAATILSALASGAMAALTLTYSLVLVVFTLAAGTIGPRLLRRFTADPVNQVTAGLFGGAFLYAICAIYLGAAEITAPFTLFGAATLAVLLVGQLIFFVRSVAESVSIDDEITEIARALRTGLTEGDLLDSLPTIDVATRFVAPGTGYLILHDADALCALAKARNGSVVLDTPDGSHVLARDRVGRATFSMSNEEHRKFTESVRTESVRSDKDVAVFNINLLLEIALRALSPGVNDSFTAIAVIDAYGAVMEAWDETGAEARVLGRGDAWMVVAALPQRSAAIERLIQPIRRAAAGNLLVQEAVARFALRLSTLESADFRNAATKIVGDLRSDLDRDTGLTKDDRDVVEQLMTQLKPVAGPAD